MSHYKNILITGASSGIGEALAIFYAASGAKTLFLSGRDSSRLETVALKCRNLGAVVYPQIIDVTNRNAMADWIEQCEKQAPLNLVIANAGVSTLAEIPDNIYNTFNTNVIGVVNTIVPTIEIYKNRQPKIHPETDTSLDRFIKSKKKQGKAFVMNPFTKMFLANSGVEFFQNNERRALAIVSSIAGYHGLPSCPSYSASKAAVKAWGGALRLSLKKDHINVSVICPGFIRSRITDKNTCPMPFFMEADKAAAIIAKRIDKNVGLIAFPWPLRFSAWLLSILPNRLSNLIYGLLPHKV